VTSGAENEIRRALASQAIQIGDKRYIVALAEWPSDSVHERVSVRFTVSSSDDMYEGEILVRRRRLDDPGLIGAVILEVAQEIIKGKLPPGEPILI
jgi:hypothetical protein